MSKPVRVFSHLALSVTDMDKLARFYIDALGFQRAAPYSAAGRRVAALMDAEPDGFDGLFLRMDDFLLELLSYRTRPESGQRPRHAAAPGFAHISLVVEDIDDTIAAVERAGGRAHRRLEHRYVGPGVSSIVFCLDPDGNRFELISHDSYDEAVAHANFLGLGRGGVGWPALDQVELR
jgi:catechol 2,3-dioxygenase-like lactoylglutathione lyase family enzyme